MGIAGSQGKVGYLWLSLEQFPRTSKEKWQWEMEEMGDRGILQLIKISVLTEPQITFPSFSIFFL